ncbi:MAG: molybdopterin molybdotransferase MoeA [Thiotrichaceae bacterium]|nr:molybdopterin molybdotransferase MoeA [Thiotrichaceae bacterium]
MNDGSPLVDAQQQFVDALSSKTTNAEICRLSAALGRTLTGDVQAPTDMPPYHRAIVEGWLVNSADTKGAGEDSPVNFNISGNIIPGDESCPMPGAGEALRVATGSIVADGPVAIIRPWEGKEEGNIVSITRPFPPRFFIEEQGYDLKQGTTAVAAGTVIGAAEIGTIASLGIDEIAVASAPKVTLFASGDEVIPYTDTLKPGSIRDSNSIMLASAVTAAGGIPVIAGIMDDNFDKFVTAVKTAIENADMIVISGGTAVGGRDFISDLLKEVGELIIDGVPMRSGRPLIMGKAGDTPIICVAGHPPEALRGFSLFGIAALNKLMDRDAELPADSQNNQPPQKP